VNAIICVPFQHAAFSLPNAAGVDQIRMQARIGGSPAYRMVEIPRADSTIENRLIRVPTMLLSIEILPAVVADIAASTYPDILLIQRQLIRRGDNQNCADCRRWGRITQLCAKDHERPATCIVAGDFLRFTEANPKPALPTPTLAKRKALRDWLKAHDWRPALIDLVLNDSTVTSWPLLLRAFIEVHGVDVDTHFRGQAGGYITGEDD
jgi:hypothetical protein